jgi:hypothetical protein
VQLGRLELQQELDARVVEAGHGRIGHHQPLGLAAELQRDAELGLLDLQVPELVLQHDGHLVRIADQQVGRRRHPRTVRLEGT